VPDDRIETQLPGRPDAAASARAFLGAALHTWRLNGFGEVAVLLTDELVSNVVDHVGEPMTLRALWHSPRLRIEVEDPSTTRPRLVHPDDQTAAGRGLVLIDALATDWGTELRPDGKTVWFELDVPPATGARHAG
jgi:anti-sigma regulatory factor (Ser/Thr protein kinase)